MSKDISDFQKMLDVNIPIIFIHNHDFVRVDEMISNALGKNVAIREWNPAVGTVNFKSKEPIIRQSLDDFLREMYAPDSTYAKDRIVVLKEIQDLIDEPQVKSLLMMIAQRRLYDHGYQNEDETVPPYSTTIVIVSSVDYIPEELIPYVSYLEQTYPDETEINQLIDAHIKVNKYQGFDEKYRKPLLQSLKGLTSFEIDRTLDMAMSENGNLTAEDTKMILAQKKQMVKKE